MICRGWKTVIFCIVALVTSLLCTGYLSLGQKTGMNRIDIQNLFTPSGWMGDGEYGRKYIHFSGADKTNPQSPPASIKITYTFGPARWGGIYWQNKPDNWGDKPGNDYSGKDFSRISFWARGEKGNEIVEFKAGDIDHPQKRYRDSFGVTIGRVTLSKEWTHYQIDLGSANLSSMIGGFCWVASAEYNYNKRITFFLDDIVLE